MNKDLFVVSFEVESVKAVDPRPPGNDDGGGNDDDKKNDKGAEDKDDDLLDDGNDFAKDKWLQDKEKTPTDKNRKGSVLGSKTVNIGIDQSDLWGQEKHLIASMNDVDDKLLTAKGLNQIGLQSTIDGEIGNDEEKQKGKNTMCIINDIHQIDTMSSL